MIIDEVKNFLLTCPFLHPAPDVGAPVITADWLGAEPTAYAIEAAPTNPIVRQYLYGALKQFTFAFLSQEYYGEDAAQNAANAGFYEAFAKWLTAKRQYSNPRWLKFETLTGGYVYDAPDTGDRARYRIQCRLLYFEE